MKIYHFRQYQRDCLVVCLNAKEQRRLVKHHGMEGEYFTKNCHGYNFHVPILYYRFEHCLADRFDMEKQKNRSQLK